MATKSKFKFKDPHFEYIDDDDDDDVNTLNKIP